MPKQFQIKRLFAKKTDDVKDKATEYWNKVLSVEKEREELALKLAKLAGKHKRLAKDCTVLMKKIEKEKNDSKKIKYKSKLEKIIDDVNNVIDAQEQLINNDSNCTISRVWMPINIYDFYTDK